MLNNKPIRMQGSVMFVAGDAITVAGATPLIIRDGPGGPDNLNLSASGPGFEIILEGFSLGMEKAVEGRGVFNDGSPMRFIVHAERLATLPAGAIYRVDYMFAEV